MHKKFKKMNDIKDNLIEWVGFEIDKGRDMCFSSYDDVKIMGEVVDMIKDISECEKNCMESCYYKSIVGAMDAAGEHEPEDKKWEEIFGYNNRRYSSGRYAPAGQGHLGYTPYMPMGYTPMYSRQMMDYNWYNNRDMPSTGYTKSQTGNMTRYGYPYEQYRDARRHYTETHTPEDKRRMDEHAKEHLNDTVATMRDIWRDADPDLKSRMKTELMNLVNEMN